MVKEVLTKYYEPEMFGIETDFSSMSFDELVAFVIIERFENYKDDQNRLFFLLATMNDDKESIKGLICAYCKRFASKYGLKYEFRLDDNFIGLVKKYTREYFNLF